MIASGDLVGPQQQQSGAAQPMRKLEHNPSVVDAMEACEKNSAAKGDHSHDMRLLPDGFQPSEHDVICGRGRKTFVHPGNERFRAIVKSFLPQYSRALAKLEKSYILSDVVEQVRQNCTDGGFVKKDPDTGKWYEVGDFLAREKTSQAFRDILYDKYKSSNTAKKKRRQHEQAGKLFRSNSNRSLGDSSVSTCDSDSKFMRVDHLDPFGMGNSSSSLLCPIGGGGGGSSRDLVGAMVGGSARNLMGSMGSGGGGGGGSSRNLMGTGGGSSRNLMGTGGGSSRNLMGTSGSSRNLMGTGGSSRNLMLATGGSSRNLMLATGGSGRNLMGPLGGSARNLSLGGSTRSLLSSQSSSRSLLSTAGSSTSQASPQEQHPQDELLGTLDQDLVSTFGQCMTLRGQQRSASARSVLMEFENSRRNLLQQAEPAVNQHPGAAMEWLNGSNGPQLNVGDLGQRRCGRGYGQQRSASARSLSFTEDVERFVSRTNNNDLEVIGERPQRGIDYGADWMHHSQPNLSFEFGRNNPMSSRASVARAPTERIQQLPPTYGGRPMLSRASSERMQQLPPSRAPSERMQQLPPSRGMAYGGASPENDQQQQQQQPNTTHSFESDPSSSFASPIPYKGSMDSMAAMQEINQSHQGHNSGHNMQDIMIDMILSPIADEGGDELLDITGLQQSFGIAGDDDPFEPDPLPEPRQAYSTSERMY